MNIPIPMDGLPELISVDALNELTGYFQAVSTNPEVEVQLRLKAKAACSALAKYTTALLQRSW
jgi:hypothetical protein